MGKVHVIGVVRNFLAAVNECGYSSVDVGPLLGGERGGPYVDWETFNEAMTSVSGMTVLIRDNGANVEICSDDGSTVHSTISTT
jgi:hypothetical protein